MGHSPHLTRGFSQMPRTHSFAHAGAYPFRPVDEWAGRRGEELVVVYRVWGGHPRRHETRWTALALRPSTWPAGPGAPRVGELGDRPDPVPERASTAPVPLVPLFGPLEPEVVRHATCATRQPAPPSTGAAAPELMVVVRDPTGPLRSAS